MQDKTTIAIPRTLVAKIKAKARKRDVPMYRIIEAAMTRYSDDLPVKPDRRRMRRGGRRRKK